MQNQKSPLQKAEKTKQVSDYIKAHGYEPLGPCLNPKSKMLLRCPSGHLPEISWNNFQQGTRCRECHKVRKLLEKSQAINKFIQDEGYSIISGYLGIDSKLDLICPNDHSYSTKWANWRQGNRCLKCQGKTKWTTEALF